MNKRQKEVIEEQLHNEEKTIANLKNTYKQALKDCEQKIRELSARTDMENLQSIIYQRRYQEALKAQLEGALSVLQSNASATVSDYLTKCYNDGYVGTMYDLHGQGIPIVTAIDQKAVVRAVETDSKLSKSLYDRMGEDVTYLKKAVRAEVSRGIANGSTWNEVAGKLSRHMANTPFQRAYNNSIRIARTEGHRIQVQSALDAQMVAKSKGADIVKQWDSTLDGNTRDLHRLLDGQIREIDEPFEAGGIQVDAPGMFGDPAEDCNCRCCLLQRARWALDDDELQRLKDRAEYFGLDKTSDFEEYKEKYLKVIDEINPTNVNGEIIQFDWKDKNQLREKQQEIISDLSNEYRTRLQKVTTGAKQSAGNVDMSGAVMRLSDSHVNTAVHEFAHTLANSTADKYGLTNDADFWKEIKKIQREYHRDVDKTSDTSRWISSYEHSSRSVDEFFAEAFTQAKMSKLKLELPPKYGADLTYSNKVLEVVDKYFKKNAIANSGKDGTITLADINKMITSYEKKVLDKIPAKSGYFDFAAHGAPDYIEYGEKGNTMSAREVARVISHNENYNGQKVRMLSCSTGSTDDGFAQQLANSLGVEVEAPTDILYVYADGHFKVGYDGSGEMKIFKPQGKR